MQTRNRRGERKAKVTAALNHDTERQEKSPDDFPYEGDTHQAPLTNGLQLQDQPPFVRIDNPDDFE